MACTKPRGLINAATLIGPIVIIFVVLGFATDHWEETDVDRSDLDDIERALSNSNQGMARIFHSRHRGIIRECYPEDSALFLQDAQNVNNDCFYIDFDDPDGVSMSSEYSRRMHLMRSVLATYVLGMVAVILAFILGLVLCLAKSCHVSHAASVCSLFGAMCILAAIVLFHAQEYVEANKDGDPGEIVFHNNWSKNLLKATDSELGYSYALAWVGLILAILDGALYILASRALRMRQLTDDDSSSDSSSSDDRDAVIKNSRRGSKGYDNYGMKYGYPAAITPAPVFMDGYPQAFIQSMPAYPTLDMGNTLYRPSGSERSRDA